MNEGRLLELHWTTLKINLSLSIYIQMIGLAKGALESVIPYIHEREAFNQKIADFQAMQHMRAQLATEIEAASLLVYNAARMKDQGLPVVKEGAMAKYYSSEVSTIDDLFVCIV